MITKEMVDGGWRFAARRVPRKRKAQALPTRSESLSTLCLRQANANDYAQCKLSTVNCQLLPIHHLPSTRYFSNKISYPWSLNQLASVADEFIAPQIIFEVLNIRITTVEDDRFFGGGICLGLLALSK